MYRYFWLDTYLQPGVSAMVSLLQFHGLRLIEEAQQSSNSVPMATTASGGGGGASGSLKDEKEHDSNPLLEGVASIVTAWRKNNQNNNIANGESSSTGSSSIVKPALSSRGGWLAYHRAAGARHNERAWAERIKRPLLHLYAPDEIEART